MKLLLVSWHYPPTNAIAAQRTGRMTEYFHNCGHQVSVLTVKKNGPDRSLAFGLDGIDIEETRYHEIGAKLKSNAFVTLLGRKNNFSNIQKAHSSQKTKPQQPSSPTRPDGKLKAMARKFYHEFFFFPDKYRGWEKDLAPALSRHLSHNPPDIIIVTGPPFSSFETVAREAKKLSIPWVAEFRDRWMDDPYDDWSVWRYWTGQRRERKTIKQAAGIVTVSPDWSAFYRQKYGLPTECVMNGFDPTLFGSGPLQPEEGLPLTLCHMGQGYANQRDPTPLFRALKSDRITPDQIQIRFYGNNLDFFQECVDREKVHEYVQILPAISHQESIKVQRQTDILFLMQSPRQTDAGNVPAKLFEYLGARRPILAVGCEGGVVNQLIDERRAGILSNSSEKLANQLRKWITQKSTAGNIQPLPKDCTKGVARSDQLAKYECFLQSLIK